MKNRKLKIFAGLSVVLVLVVGVVGIAIATTDYSVRVADRTEFATVTLPDDAIIEYWGDNHTTYGSAGTGTFDSFVRAQGKAKKTDSEKNYNTDGVREFDTKGGKWTHSILLSEIPTIDIDGQLYLEFFADINDNNDTPLISLDDFELYLTTDPNLTGYNGTWDTAPNEMVYDFNADNPDSHILINDVNQGSGRGDLRYLVPNGFGPPECNYGNPLCTTYLVLYSEWGAREGYGFDGGFEEWKVKEYPILQVSKDIYGDYDTPVTWTITKDFDATYDLFDGESVTHAYEVSVDPIFGAPVNTKVYGTITILGDEDDAVNANISDKFEGDDATITGCSVQANSDGTYPIAARSTVTCQYVLTLTGGPVSGTNAARATYEIDGVKLAFEGSADIIEDDFVKTLTGDPEIDVTDTDGETWSETWSANAASVVRTYERTFTCDADEGQNINTATIDQTGQSDDATVILNCYDLNVTKTAHGFYSRYFEWDITKSVAPESWAMFTGESGTSDYTVNLVRTGFHENDWQVSGAIRIANSHPTRDADLDQVLDNAGGIPGDVNCASMIVPAGGSLVCSYATAVQDAVDANPFGDTNTATATQQLYDFATSGAETPHGTKDYAGTHAINFAEIDVELVDEEATVSDTYAGSTVVGTYAGDKTFTYSRTFTCDADGGQHDNTASFATNDTPLTGSDDASVTVDCYDLNVTKTADEFYTRTFEWYILKSVDNPGPITVQRGGSVDVNYQVEVGVLRFTDNDWQVTGNITIANSHPTRNADLNQVIDNAGGITGVVSCGSLTVPAGGSLVCSYVTAVQDAVDANPFGGTNTATATQQLYDFASSGAATADGTKDYFGTSPIIFGEPTNYVDEQIVVNDSVAGYLGTVNALTDTPPVYFTYARTITPDEVTCGEITVDNTATFTTTDTGTTGSASASVIINVPCEGCTPGFWRGGAGSLLWDDPVDPGDPQWVYGGVNPFVHGTLFNDFFNTVTDNRLNGQTMFQIVSNDGGIANSAEKAARDMVAAYLNESAFPGTFPADTLAALKAEWYAAVTGGDSALDAFHILVGGWNNPPEGGYCPLP